MTSRPPREGYDITPMSVYDALHARYGDLGWWPAESPFEVMVGAVLTQRTAWRNVEIALDNLRGSRVTDMASLLDTTTEELETLVRPSGTYRQKAARLKALFEHVDLVGDGSLEEYLDRPLETLREDLLSVNGIGPETADSIILYAADRPVFVVDAYTRRVLGRLDIDPGRSYDDVAGWFMDGLPRDADIYNNFHACLVELAKSHCRRDPSCRGCPLGPVCPTGRGEKTP